MWLLAAPKQVISGSKVEASVLHGHRFCSILLVTQVSLHSALLGGNCLRVQMLGHGSLGGHLQGWPPHSASMRAGALASLLTAVRAQHSV